MSDNLWGEEENFSDMPEEAQTGTDGKPVPVSAQPFIAPPPSRPAPTRQARPIAPPAPEPIEEEVEEVVEEDYADVLSDAHLRLEQGSLYKMIMNHNLFEGIDADPKAIKNVEKEIRQFARERMEVMLGMRKETATIEQLEIDFPFNELEVQVLRTMAKTFSKGATENSDRYVPSVTRTTEEVEMVPRRKTLNPIGSAPTKKAASSKPLQNRASAPVKRGKLDVTIDQIAREEGVPRELLEENVSLLEKPINELSESELIERNKIVAKRRGASVKSANALPMATPAQQEMMALERASQMANSGGALMGKILDAVKAMPIKNP